GLTIEGVGLRIDQLGVVVAGIGGGLLVRLPYGIGISRDEAVGVEALLLDVAIGVGDRGLHDIAVERIGKLEGATIRQGLRRTPPVGVVELRNFGIPARIDDLRHVAHPAIPGRRRTTRSIVGIPGRAAVGVRDAAQESGAAGVVAVGDGAAQVVGGLGNAVVRINCELDPTAVGRGYLGDITVRVPAYGQCVAIAVGNAG